MSNQNKIIWYLPIIMLLLCFFHWPYKYYIILRFVVSGCAGYIAYQHTEDKILSIQSIIFILITILFNPVLPIYFSKSSWAILDIACAIIFLINFITFKSSLEKKNA
jgi:hypothetical protein